MGLLFYYVVFSVGRLVLFLGFSCFLSSSFLAVGFRRWPASFRASWLFKEIEGICRATRCEYLSNKNFPSDMLKLGDGAGKKEQAFVQAEVEVTEQDERLITMASPMQAKESKHIKETVWNNRDLFEESTSSFSVTSAVTKLNRIDNIKSASDVKLHDGTSTYNLENRNIFIVGNESKVINNQHIVQKRISSGTDENIIDGTTSTPSSHLIHEDSILPGASALSGPIIASGHIPYSGNLSLRSDSSTTSTHSFAFPILQSEWNSSPVKMAKADRRHSRKHRWRTVLCCKF